MACCSLPVMSSQDSPAVEKTLAAAISGSAVPVPPPVRVILTVINRVAFFDTLYNKIPINTARSAACTVISSHPDQGVTVTLRPAIPISLRETPNAVKLRFLSVPTLKNTSNLVGE